MKLITSYIYRWLDNKTFRNSEHVYLHMLLIVADIFVLLVHMLLCALFFSYGQQVLAIVYLAAVFINSTCFFLIRKGNYELPGFIITIEVILHALLSVYLLGADNYIYVFFFLCLIMQLLVPYTSAKRRGVVIALMWVLMLTSYVIQFGRTPAMPLTPAQNSVFAVINTQVGFLGILLELVIGNVFSKIIASYQELQMREMTTRANTDPLTGLFNRRYAYEMIKHLRTAENGAHWCVAMLDIDDFKLVNDTYGHAVGDVVLKWLADFMRDSLRKTDVVFRWGGEEFLLLLDNVDASTAYLILDKLRCSIAGSEISVQELKLRITVTVGMAPLNVSDPDSSVEVCDQKMYEGKQSTKNVVVR